MVYTSFDLRNQVKSKAFWNTWLSFSRSFNNIRYYILKNTIAVGYFDIQTVALYATGGSKITLLNIKRNYPDRKITKFDWYCRYASFCTAACTLKICVTIVVFSRMMTNDSSLEAYIANNSF